MSSLSRKDLRWIFNAAAYATRASGDYMLGSVIVRSGSVLSWSYNEPRNDPAWIDRGWSIHAEARALKKCGNAQGATIYIARVTPGGRLAIAKPCPACMDSIVEAGIRTVVWTTDTGATVKSSVSDLLQVV